MCGVCEKIWAGLDETGVKDSFDFSAFKSTSFIAMASIALASFESFDAPVVSAASTCLFTDDDKASLPLPDAQNNAPDDAIDPDACDVEAATRLQVQNARPLFLEALQSGVRSGMVVASETEKKAARTIIPQDVPRVVPRVVHPVLAQALASASASVAAPVSIASAPVSVLQATPVSLTNTGFANVVERMKTRVRGIASDLNKLYAERASLSRSLEAVAQKIHALESSFSTANYMLSECVAQPPQLQSVQSPQSLVHAVKSVQQQQQLHQHQQLHQQHGPPVRAMRA